MAAARMSIDQGALPFLLIGTCLMVGLMLLVAWMYNRQPPYLWWSAGFATSAAGLTLMSIGFALPDILAGCFGTVLLLFGLGLCWAGVRRFDNRPIDAWPVAIGVLAWTAIYLIPAIRESGPARSAILSIMIAAYSLAIAHELWQGRGEPLASRLPLAVLCAVNGGIHLINGVLAYIAPGEGLTGDLWFAVSLLQPALIMVAGGLYAIGLARDRTEAELRQRATIDPLTKVLNRGAFLEHAQGILSEVGRDGAHVAILMFDLDRFKAINDNFGHTAGDKVLSVFARAASSVLRNGDLFGRLGGEEFAAVLPNLDEAGARVVAERVRRQFAAAVASVEEIPIPVSVSIGVVSQPGGAANLNRLLVRADEALYEAKRLGRNQVRGALALVG